MDQDPQDNQPPTSYKLQYHWLSPLRDIQPGIFNLELASNPEDNPIHGIDPELFAERATNTSARTGTSTNLGYQTHYHRSNPPRDVQSGILNPDPATNPENNPIFGVDPATLTERATHSSASAGPLTHSGFQHQDIQTNNQSYSWPTTSITSMNQSSNRTSLDTDTHWPAYQGLNSQNTEADTKTPSTTFMRPDTKHPSDQPTEGHGSTEQQKHYHNRRNQHPHNTPNIGTTPGRSNINWEQRSPREGKSLRMEAPHVPQHRTGLSQSYSNISVSNANIPMAPTNTPSAHPRPPASCNHKDQYTDGIPVIGKASKQFSDQQGHERPQEGTIHHKRNPQTPQHWIHPLQSRPGTSGANSNGQKTPIGTPSTSTKTESPSTSTISTPRRTRGNMSPIRFPTPEPDGLPTSSSLGWDSSNLSLNLNAP